MKTKAEAKAGQTFDQFQAISYRQQVVAGMNYLIEVSSVMFHNKNLSSFCSLEEFPMHSGKKMTDIENRT